MKVVIDTHVLFWILTEDTDKLTAKALNTLKNADIIFLPSIVLLELLGLLQKKKSLKLFDRLLRQIPKSRYLICPLDTAIIKETRKFGSRLELHDAVIMATAKHLKLPLITKDEEIGKRYKDLIW